jgi:hypothetical protein
VVNAREKPMTAASIQDRVLEFFTLQDATRQIGAVSEETRASVHRDLRIAFQKREAAETLWPRGSTAEALLLARTATELASSALGAFPEPRAAWVEKARTLAADAVKRLEGATLPALESDAKPSDEELFRALVDALIAIEEAAGISLAAVTDLRRIRNARVTTVAVIAILGVALLVFLFHKPPFSHAVASAQLADYTPDKAIDGDPNTAWLTPDRVGTGWLDLTLTRARSVGTLHILASNPPWNDRDVREAHIDALLAGNIVKSVDVTFPEPAGKDPSWTDVALDAPKSDHIRITVKSNYKVSAGIAEVEIK